MADAIELGDDRRVHVLLAKELPSPGTPIRRPEGTPQTPNGYRGPPASATLAVMTRDGWSCRYCHVALAPSALIWALHEAAPHLVQYNFNGRKSETAPALYQRWVDVDHLTSPRREPPGHPSDTRNLVAVCRRCNLLKSARKPSELGLGSLPQGATGPGWEAVSSLYVRLRARRIDHHHDEGCCNHPRPTGFDHSSWERLSDSNPPPAAHAAVEPDGVLLT